MTMSRDLPRAGAVSATSAPSGFRQRHLLALAGAAALPVLIFAVIVVLLFSQEQRRNVEAQLLQLAQGNIGAADLILANRVATLESLAVLARAGELNGLRAQIHRLLEPGNTAWLAISLDEGETHTVYEQRPDTPLPQDVLKPTSSAPHGRLAVESAVLVGQVDGKRVPVLVLRVPLGAAAPNSFVTGVLSPAPFSNVLAEQGIPDGWTAAVLNPQNLMVGRSRAGEQFVGTPATAALAEHLKQGASGYYFSVTKEGQPVYTAFATSPETGWTAAVGAPRGMITGPVGRSEFALIVGGAAAVLCAAALALLLVRSIATRNESERRAMRAEADRQTEQRLADIAAHFPGVIYRRILHADGSLSYPYVGGGAADLLGLPSEPASSDRSVEELAGSYLQPADRQRWKDAVAESARTLADYDVDGEFRRANGTAKWLRSIATTHRGADGSVIWDGLILDITDLKEAQAALLQETETLEAINAINGDIGGELNLDRLVQSVTDAGTRLTGAKFGAFFYNLVDERGESYMLYALSGVDREAFAQFPMPRNTAVFGPTFRGEGIIRLDDVTEDPRYGGNDPHRGMPEGHLPVRSYLAVPVTTRAGKTIGGLFFGHPEVGVFNVRHERIAGGIAAQAAIGMDNARLYRDAEREIAERKRAEEHQALLVAELNHRVRNTLAIVLSIAQQTSKHTDSLETFGRAFTGRIHALAGAHTLLSDSNWTTTPLRVLAQNAVAAHTAPGSERVSISGPNLTVPPRPAVAISLILHELATNAAKYGALSVPHGRVDVHWELRKDDSEVYFRWEENDGPRVNTPSRTGFGTQLIELNVTHELGGKRVRTYRPEGLICELWFPASALAEGASDLPKKSA